MRFQILSVFVMVEVGSRRLVPFNVTAPPTGAWAWQPFREALGNDPGYRFLTHDRDSIYSEELDLAVRALGVSILKTPFHSPQAHSHGERLIGSLRRECLGFLIPIHVRHQKGLLTDWKTHSCQARPPVSLGPGLPKPGEGLPAPLQEQRHQVPAACRVRTKSILGGLHHEQRLEKIAA